MWPELTAIVISFASIHIPYDEQNYINPGIHLELENYRAGLYRNSNRYNGESHYTSYVGYTLPAYRTNIGGLPIQLGIFGALASGYQSPIVGALELRVGDRLVVSGVPSIPSKFLKKFGIDEKVPTILGFAYRIPLE